MTAGLPITVFLTFTLTFMLLRLHLWSFSRAGLVFLTGPLRIAGVVGALIFAQALFWVCGVAGDDCADGHDPAHVNNPH